MSTTKAVASVVHEAASRRNAERQCAQKRYIELLTADSGTEADVKELLSICELLDKSSAEINADRAVITEAQALAEAIRSSAGCEHIRETLQRMVQQNHQRRLEQVKALDEQHQRLSGIASRAHDAVANDGRKRDELAELKRSNPQLLTGVVMPDAGLPQKTFDAVAKLPALAKWKAEYVELQVQPRTEQQT